MPTPNGYAADFVAASSESLTRANGSLAGMSFTTAFSFHVLVNLNSTPANQGFVSKLDGGLANGFGFMTNSNTELFMWIDGATAYAYTSGFGLTAGVTYSFVGVYDGSQPGNDRFKLYCNGSPVTLAYGGTIGATVAACSADFFLGMAPFSGSKFCDGVLDSAFVWDVPLTSSDATWLYNSGDGHVYGDLAGGRPALLTGLVAAYDLDQTASPWTDSASTNDLTGSASLPTRVSGLALASSSFSVSPSSVVQSTTGNTLTLTGSGTSWTSGTTFSVTGGTVTGTSVNAGTQVATLTYTAPSSAGTVTVSDSTDIATASLTVTAGPTVSTPTFSVGAGTITPQPVSISCATGGATVV